MNIQPELGLTSLNSNNMGKDKKKRRSRESRRVVFCSSSKLTVVAVALLP
jgi:hypothetical protein